MNQAADKTTHSPSGKNPSVMGTLGMDFIDTAWRIAVPVVIFAAAGIVADRSFSTAPWVTIVSVIAGFTVSGMLVKRQLSALEQEEKKHES